MAFHMVGLLSVLLLLFAMSSMATGREYISNGGFESPFSWKWTCIGCTMERVQGGTSGSWSARVTKRTHNWAGISQNVALQAGRRYVIKAKVKLLNSPNNRMWYPWEGMLHIKFTNGKDEYKVAGRLPFGRQDEGWTSLYGEVSMPGGAFSQVRFYIQAADASLNYQVDDVSITDLVHDNNWKEKANQRIHQIRKSDAQITVDVTSGMKWDGIDVEVNQVRHTFAFGSAVAADLINSKSATAIKYQNFFYDNFQWAVLENALKWRMMEWSPGKIDWDKPERAVNTLRSKGITVRGHCVYWGIEKFTPAWLKPMNSIQVRNELNRRLDVVSRFSGKLAHWDVNNENLHGKWFQEKTGDPKLMESMFRGTRSRDSNVKMYLNDYNVVAWNEATGSYINQGQTLKNANVGLYGLGIQSHIEGYPDIHAKKSRLDALSTVGLPLLITELDVNLKDVYQRANGYEDVLRLYFSHPAVEGVLLWGFWNKRHWKPDAALVDGDNFQINEAGKRWQKLVKQEWKTWRKFKLTSQTQTFGVRGFHGDYEIYIKQYGKTIKVQKFKIVKSGSNKIRITV